MGVLEARKNRRRVEIMHSSKGGNWRKSTRARRNKYDKVAVNMRVKIIIAVWQKNQVLKGCNSVSLDE